MSSVKFLFALPLAAAIAMAQTPCDQLKLSIPDTTVTSVDFVPAGPFVAPAAPVVPNAPASGRGRGGAAAPGRAGAPGRGGQPAASVPAYCRVQLLLTPSSDSHIEAS